MDRDELLSYITVEDIIKLLAQLGSAYPMPDNDGNLYFQTICHGGKRHKLLYYKESKLFMCYTCCGSMSLYDLIMSVNNCPFEEAFKYIADFKGINIHNAMKKGLQENITSNEDFEFLDKHLFKPKKQQISLPYFNKNILKIFDQYYPDVWEQEDIKEEVAKYFDIGFYFNQYKAIIPHYDIKGNLVGIRSRNFLQQQIDAKKKYIPITIQGLTYRYPMQFNLYGIYQNKTNIQKYKTAIIFESEKSVLKYASYYGQNKNIALASSGMSISLYQRDLLLQLGINEVVIAFDKQYEIEYLSKEYKNTRQHKEYVMYIKNLIKISKMFMNYCNVSIVVCWDNRLDYKDAPIDKGIHIFEELYRERYLISNIEELEELVI